MYFFYVWSHCLCCCVLAFSSCSEQGLLSGCGVWASHCSGLPCCRAWALGRVGFGNCGTQALLSHACAIFPQSGIEPMPPASAGGLPTTGPPGKSPLPSLIVYLVALGLPCCTSAPLVAVSRVCSLLWCAGFSLWQLLLLQSPGSRCMGFRSCTAQAPWLWL